MKFIDKLYFGSKASESKKSVLKDIRKGKYLPGVCVVTLPSNADNVLDIIEVYTLLQPAINTEDMTVVGIAFGKEEAMEVVRRIVDDTYRELGEIDIIRYLGLV